MWNLLLVKIHVSMVVNLEQMDLRFVSLYINFVFCRSISWSYGFAVLSDSLFLLIFYFSLGSSKLHRLQLNKHQFTNLPLPKSLTRRRENSTRIKSLQCWGLQRVSDVDFSSTSTLPPSPVIFFFNSWNPLFAPSSSAPIFVSLNLLRIRDKYRYHFITYWETSVIFRPAL